MSGFDVILPRLYGFRLVTIRIKVLCVMAVRLLRILETLFAWFQ